MKLSPTSWAPGRAPARRLALLLMVVAGVWSCDGPTTPTIEDPTGIWESTTSRFVVEITETELTFWDGTRSTQCYEAMTYGIAARNGTLFSLSSQGGSLWTLDVQRSGDQLVLRDPATGQSERLAASETDPTTLEVCTYPGADPAVTCDSLPLLVPAQSVTDSLTADEPLHQGFHYDLYRFEFVAPGPAHLDMTSPDFDAYLRVYTADGTLVAENDDASPFTTDAGFIVQVNAGGCYRVEATSFSEGSTGAYTLTLR